jgi:hypothetical protein
LKALAKSPTDRYCTAADMARDLRNAIGGRPARWRNWHALIATAACLLVLALGFTTLKSGSTPAIAPIPPQKAALAVDIQPGARPADATIPVEEIEKLTADDALQITARIDGPGYFYCLWYQPNGTVKLLGEERLERPSPPRSPMPNAMCSSAHAGKRPITGSAGNYS